MAEVDAELLMQRATAAHDETCQSCDRRYRMSCPNMAAAILAAGPCATHSPEVRCGACSHVPFPEPPRRMDCTVGGHSPAVRCGGCRD